MADDPNILDVPPSGPQGATGPQGAIGPQGAQGAQGAAGTISASSAIVATSQSTASATYVDLTTVGPEVTLTVNTSVMVIVTAGINSNAASDPAGFVGYAVSGANTIAATDTTAMAFAATISGGVITLDPFVRGSAVSILTGLTPGSTTFTAKYRAAGNTTFFVNRSIVVVPLN